MMASRILLALFALFVIIGQGTVSGLICTSNNDCALIERGSTKQCVGRVCACMPNYVPSPSGCDLTIPAPSLSASSSVEQQGVGRGGNIAFKCVPRISTIGQTSVKYRLFRDTQEVQAVRDNNTFYLTNFDDGSAGTYTCDHTYDHQRSPMSNELVIRVVEAGKVCYTDLGCPKTRGYDGSCDLDKKRCDCADMHYRKGTSCVPDGAPTNMAASLVMILTSLLFSRLF